MKFLSPIFAALLFVSKVAIFVVSAIGMFHWSNNYVFKLLLQSLVILLIFYKDGTSLYSFFPILSPTSSVGHSQNLLFPSLFPYSSAHCTYSVRNATLCLHVTLALSEKNNLQDWKWPVTPVKGRLYKAPNIQMQTFFFVHWDKKPTFRNSSIDDIVINKQTARVEKLLILR